MHEEAPAPEYVPTGQDVHVTVPVVPVYVPAAQLVQADAPAAEYVPVGHAVHVTVLVVPV